MCVCCNRECYYILGVLSNILREIVQDQVNVVIVAESKKNYITLPPNVGSSNTTLLAQIELT